MGRHHGAGTLRKRGDIWYVSHWFEGKQYQKSSHSSDIREAKKLRDQILGRKARGEIGSVSTEQVTCGQLLDDVPDHSKAKAKASMPKSGGS